MLPVTNSDWQHPAQPAEPQVRLYPQSCPEPGPPAPQQLWPCPCGSEADLRPHASRSRRAASTHPIPRGRAQGPPPECRPGPVTFQTHLAHHQPGPASQDPTQSLPGPWLLREPLILQSYTEPKPFWPPRPVAREGGVCQAGLRGGRAQGGAGPLVTAVGLSMESPYSGLG